MTETAVLSNFFEKENISPLEKNSEARPSNARTSYRGERDQPG